MKKLLIFVLIIATLLAVSIVPMASASTDDFAYDVEFEGDDIVSDKIESDKEWEDAFAIFSELNDAYYGVGDANPNVKVSFNIAGRVLEGAYANGIFHDIYPGEIVGGEIEYDHYYHANLRSFSYADGEVEEIHTDGDEEFKPVLINVINDKNLGLNLLDLEGAWNRESYGEYDYDARGYTKDGAPTVRFKDGKIVNIMFTMKSNGSNFLAEVNFDYGTAVVPLPTALALLRNEGKWVSNINDAFGGVDYNVADFMNKIANSFAGGIATFLAKAVSLITEKGLIFFFIAIVMMCFVRTRKAGLLMFISVAVGAVFTNFVLKDFIMRTRPYETNTIYYDFWMAVGAPLESGYSFPSGHTTAVMAAAMAFFVSFRKKYSWVGFIAVLAVGVSRIYLMAHYASDVLAGVLVGGVAGILSVFITKLLYYIIMHFGDSDLCKAILEKDVADVFRKKQPNPQTEAPATAPVQTTPVAPVVETTPVEAVEDNIEAAPVEEAKSTKNQSEVSWEVALLSLMTEVRDLLKANNGNPNGADKVIDEIETTVKTDDKTE